MMKPFLFFLAAFLLMAACSVSPAPKRPSKAVAGLLDLRAWDFEHDGVVKLEGGWEFYWNRLLTPADFLSNPRPAITGIVPIPSAWISYTNGTNHFPAYGCATYRLRLLCPAGRNMHFRIPDLATSYRVFVNGALAGTNGVVATAKRNYAPAKQLVIIGVPSPDGDYELVVQVANFNYYKGGMWSAIEAGSEKAVTELTVSQRSVESFIIGILSIIILYHLGLFIIRRKDRTPLVFSLLCLCIMLRVLATGSYILQQIFPFVSWSMLIQAEYLMLILPVPIALHYLYLLFDRKFPWKLLLTLYIMSWTLGLSVILTEPGFFTRFVNVYEGFLVVTSLILIGFLVRMSLRKNLLSVIILTGFVVVILTVFNDILFSKLIFTAFGYLVPLGFISLVFSQSLALSIKFSQAFREVEDLSQNLDLKVQARTSELNATLARQGELNNRLLNTAYELEKEKTELKHKTETMEAELQMARNIQMKMIPGKSPSERISFFYQSMEQVGGDFFDFIAYPGGKVGIFISDVSGHGVPAAFITSMIKSTFSQVAPAISNPAFLLKHLNEVLYNQTTGNFVTALYGIVDFKKREFIFASAGHPAPWILDESGARMTESPEKSFPLCMMPNSEMQEMKREYRNSRIELPEGCKLLLYTDGLTEAVRASDPGDNIPDFETCELPQALHESGPKPVDSFVRGLSDRLARFHGSDRFDDDVCIIGVQG